MYMYIEQRNSNLELIIMLLIVQNSHEISFWIFLVSDQGGQNAMLT